jgi:hypothetical protein
VISLTVIIIEESPSYQLRVSENRVLRRIFGPKRRKTDGGENCIMMNLTTCILHRILLG